MRSAFQNPILAKNVYTLCKFFISQMLITVLLIHVYTPLKPLACPESQQGCRAPLWPEPSPLRHTAPAVWNKRKDKPYQLLFQFLYLFVTRRHVVYLWWSITAEDRWWLFSPQQETPGGRRSSLHSARRAVGVCGRAKSAGEGAPAVSQSGPDTLPDSGSHRSATGEKTGGKEMNK